MYSCSRGYKPLGNINEKGFSEIWNSDIYRRFRRDALEINRRKSPVEDCDCYIARTMRQSFEYIGYFTR